MKGSFLLFLDLCEQPELVVPQFVVKQAQILTQKRQYEDEFVPDKYYCCCVLLFGHVHPCRTIYGSRCKEEQSGVGS